ncbi:MAG: carboxymuconolactone decarboxylase family protein [Chlorobi bacterium]|nr:carboxymuconolactone decarboxylase family protein [Chlorobiota bacterium]
MKIRENNPLEVFKTEAPEIQKAFAGVIDALIGSKGLDPKTKQLVYIAMKVVSDDFAAIKHHVPMAKALGASREEIKEVILLSLTVQGLKGISKFLPMALETYDNS